jgi:hypothetical protein
MKCKRVFISNADTPRCPDCTLWDKVVTILVFNKKLDTDYGCMQGKYGDKR